MLPTDPPETALNRCQRCKRPHLGVAVFCQRCVSDRNEQNIKAKALEAKDYKYYQRAEAFSTRDEWQRRSLRDVLTQEARMLPDAIDLWCLLLGKKQVTLDDLNTVLPNIRIEEDEQYANT